MTSVDAPKTLRALLSRAEAAEKMRDYNSEVIEQRNSMLIKAEAERDAAKAQTMLRDFDNLRKAIRNWNPEETEKAFEKCERWIACINPTAKETTND